jgi:hypothetical protein
MEHLRWAIVTCLSLFVSACGAPGPEQRLDAYRESVGALVATKHLVDGAPVRDVLLPARRERRMEVAEHRVSLFEFLALRGCRLGELAGDRNSQLGRVMVPSRQLIY